DVLKPREVNRQQGEDRAQLDQDRKGIAEIVVAEAKKMLHQKQVPGRGYRDVFREALDDAEASCLENIEQHGQELRGKRAKLWDTKGRRNGRESQCLWRNPAGWARECLDAKPHP